ncbi:hypothetical protein PMAC_001165 [Pneumocystis sp. 'macacae']|nr:hypothetical protein PMAC_001165 [Pneumocystis sp. 'macacae']
MSLDQTQENWKTFFHVLPGEDGEELCNNTQSLLSPSNISDMLQNGVEPYKLIENSSNPQIQQLDQPLHFSDTQGSFSSPYFSLQQADSIIGLSHQGEMGDSTDLSSPSSIGISNLFGYCPETVIQGGYTPESHFSQQHPYLILQQQSLGSLGNNHYEQRLCFPSVAEQFSSVYPYLTQRNMNYAFWMNEQSLSNGKFESFLPFTSPLHQAYDYDNTMNYQSYSQFLPLQNNYLSMGSTLYTTCGELCTGCSNCISSQPVPSNRITGDDNNSSLYIQLPRNHYSSKKKLNSAKSPFSVRSTKTSNVFSSRPFKCDQCFQSFNRNHDLKRHKRIHLDVKLFPCSSCDKSFSRKDALKRHALVKGCVR